MYGNVGVVSDQDGSAEPGIPKNGCLNVAELFLSATIITTLMNKPALAKDT
jgi:hypothetical protein